MMIYQSLCRSEKPFFLKVQHPGLKRVVMRTYTQSKLTNIMNKEDVVLYRNDAIGIFKNISRLEIERKKKAIVTVF